MKVLTQSERAVLTVLRLSNTPLGPDEIRARLTEEENRKTSELASVTLYRLLHFGLIRAEGVAPQRFIATEQV